MIYIFSALKEGCGTCCQCCGSCAHVFADFCEDFCQDPLWDRPLGIFLLMTWWFGPMQVVFVAYALSGQADLANCAMESSIGKEVGILNWLYGQGAAALVHMVFALYIQNQVWKKLRILQSGTDASMDAGGVTAGDVASAVGRGVATAAAGPAAAFVGDSALSSAKVKQGVLEVFLYDIGVCLYVFFFIAAYIWSYFGTEWANATMGCDYDGWAIRSAYTGEVFFWLALAYAIGWFLLIRVFDFGGEVFGQYMSPAVAAATVDSPGTATPAAPTAAAPPGPRKKGLEKMCTIRQMLKLIACLGLDFVGDASYLIPSAGELGDAAFAPLQALALKAMFEANGLAALGLVEELLPFTDVLPTATLGWVLDTFAIDSVPSKLLGIGRAERRRYGV
eukprot:TRINITY_DN58296_c0_g1_i1.p1 TRINITY_DN58296_c0_g1~~TRINITY_DN58296_c0_g1_i1.p1  ORF type:complete len:392 (+),score=58.28 TRINITY_DN58296_c0_g1_i1:68-1243(+)